MRQRVGFARALVVEPEVLFMDEPFSALDVLTAENLRSELLELWQKKTIPTKAIFLVTHNIEEAVLLADRIIVLGRNPGHVRTDFKVTLAQPRDRKSSAFTQLVDYIYKVLTQPDVKPGDAPLTSRPRSVRDQRQMHYEMLPHARPGGIAGLLEMLIDHQGKTDIYKLADELAFDIDDLLPIVDAAKLLGFLTVNEGDAAITAVGAEFANSEILHQKELFRAAAVEHVLLLRQIVRALDSKSDHSVPEEFFHDILDEQFSEEETLSQIETAVSWGRYAELFDFDAASRRFILPEKEVEDPVPSPPTKRARPNEPPRQPLSAWRRISGAHAGAAPQLAIPTGRLCCRHRTGHLLRRASPGALLAWPSGAGTYISRFAQQHCRSMPSTHWCASGSPISSACSSPSATATWPRTTNAWKPSCSLHWTFFSPYPCSVFFPV
jgi:NitT/TauT family transport system ATP-binding protein